MKSHKQSEKIVFVGVLIAIILIGFTVVEKTLEYLIR